MHLPHLKPIDALVPAAPHPPKGVARAGDRSRIAPASEDGGRRNPNHPDTAPEQETAGEAEALEASVETAGAAETMLAHLIEHDLEVAEAEAPELDAAALEARERYEETARAA